MDKGGSVSTDAILKYEEVLAATKEYFKGDDLAAMVWVNKYALRTRSTGSTRAHPQRCIGELPTRLPASRITTPTR